MHESVLAEQIRASIATKERLLARCLGEIEALCAVAERAVAGGGKLMFCGNGGSACDAAHAVGELVGWFEDKQRDGIAALALGHEVPTLTAIGNDAGYVEVFARQLRALGRPGDLLIGISTSGGSRNVVRALAVARELGIATAALASERGGPVVELADVAVRVPSADTARIQESHLLVVHLLCGHLERAQRA
ncbi:MAG: SIS domain-containing protein [Planctomycetes bacterium]|nr:SIS domain-containing protein [Planctomycetota bacterium]